MAESLELRMESDPAALSEARRRVEAFAVAGGLVGAAAEQVALCVHEALANVIRHAYQGQAGRPIQVVVEVAGGELVVRIRDWGSGVDPASDPRFHQPHEPLAPGGLGTLCLRRFMDTVRFDPQPDGMLLTMTKGLGGHG